MKEYIRNYVDNQKIDDITNVPYDSSPELIKRVRTKNPDKDLQLLLEDQHRDDEL